MSYDLRMSGPAVARATIETALRRVPHGGLRPDIYVGDADGNVIDVPREQANMVTHAVLCVPTSYGQATKVHVDAAVTITDAIATVTRWRVFDPQLDAYLDDFDHPWRAEQPAAAHQIGALEASAEELTIHTAPHVGHPAV